MDLSLPDRIPPYIARMLDQGFDAMDNGEYVAALAYLETARQAAKIKGNQSALLAIHQLLGVLAFQHGDYAAAQRNQQHVLQQSEALGLRLGEASALHNLGLIAAQQGDLDKACELIDRAIAHYSELGKLEAAEKAQINRRNITRTWGPLEPGQPSQHIN